MLLFMYSVSKKFILHFNFFVLHFFPLHLATHIEIRQKFNSDPLNSQ